MRSVPRSALPPPARGAARPRRAIQCPGIWRAGRSGHSLIEVMVVLALLTLAANLGGAALDSLRRGRVRVAAREIAAQLRQCRLEAALGGRSVAMRLRERSDGWSFGVYADGNGNGVRGGEIEDGRDMVLRPEESFRGRFHGVDLRILDGPIPAVPPAGGLLDGPDPVRFGRADLISFSPRGTSSSGTLYLSDGVNRMAAVRLFGPTGRMRIWEYTRDGGEWVLLSSQ